MIPQIDYYRLLELPRTARPQEVREAYLRLAYRLHPDLNPRDPHGDDRFKQLREAYEVLSDPQRRAEYDARRSGRAGKAVGPLRPAYPGQGGAGPWRSSLRWLPSRRACDRRQIAGYAWVFLGGLVGSTLTVALLTAIHLGYFGPRAVPADLRSLMTYAVAERLQDSAQSSIPMQPSGLGTRAGTESDHQADARAATSPGRNAARSSSPRAENRSASEGADHEVRRPSDSKSRADRGPRRRRGPGLAVDEPPAVMPSLPLWPFDESPTAGGRLPEPPSEPLTTLDPWIDGAHFSGNMAVSVPREFDYKREEFSEKAVVDLSERNWREPNRSWALADEPAGVEIDASPAAVTMPSLGFVTDWDSRGSHRASRTASEDRRLAARSVASGSAHTWSHSAPLSYARRPPAHDPHPLTRAPRVARAARPSSSRNVTSWGATPQPASWPQLMPAPVGTSDGRTSSPSASRPTYGSYYYSSGYYYGYDDNRAYAWDDTSGVSVRTAPQGEERPASRMGVGLTLGRPPTIGRTVSADWPLAPRTRAPRPTSGYGWKVGTP